MSYNTEYTDCIVCPHCGYIDEDSADLFEDYSTDNKCHDCGKVFGYERIHRDVVYCSFEIEND